MKDKEKEFKFPDTQPTPLEAAQFRAHVPNDFRGLKGLKPGLIDEFRPSGGKVLDDEFLEVNQAFGLKPKFS